MSKTQLFACNLEEIFKPHNDINDFLKTVLVQIQLDVPLQMALLPTSIHPYEAQNFIKCLSDNKSLGYDLIKNVIINILPWKTIIFLTSIYNSNLKITQSINPMEIF